jgi:cytochrome oxidase Cu insertion factor (SCO1/SenC/PrrC family)
MRRAAALLLLGAALGGGVAAAHDVKHPPDASPAALANAPAGLPPGIPGLGGPFHLIDHTGAPRSDADYRGRFMLVFFGFTNCPDVCPTELHTVADALDRLPPATAARVAPLFITVDPHNDTPERLAEYVAQFHPAIVGLSGSDKDIAGVVRAYRVHVIASASKDPTQISHTAFMYLMGPDGGFLSLIMPGSSAEEIAVRIAKYAA